MNIIINSMVGGNKTTPNSMTLSQQSFTYFDVALGVKQRLPRRSAYAPR